MAQSPILKYGHQLLRNFLVSQGARRCLATTPSTWGPDSRDKRSGHLPKTDKLEGEQGSIVASEASYELVDEHLMNRVINGIRFKDIPILTIKCTRNNTKMHLVRAEGTEVAYKSAGTEGFKNCRKGTTVAAESVAKRILTLATDNEIDTVRLVFNGLGPGRNAAYKAIETSNLNVVSLSDMTDAVEPWRKRPRKAKRI